MRIRMASTPGSLFMFPMDACRVVVPSTAPVEGLQRTGCPAAPTPPDLPKRGHMPQPRIALLIVDMINPFDFDGGARLAVRTGRVVRRISRLKERIKAGGGICLYVNDNFGMWQSDFRQLVARVRTTRGDAIADALLPVDDDRFVLKPKHSGFFQTPLPLLLEHEGVDRVVVTGIATDACVLATALDAHMRDLDCHVPSDCTEAMTDARRKAALTVLRGIGIHTGRARTCEFLADMPMAGPMTWK